MESMQNIKIKTCRGLENWSAIEECITIYNTYYLMRSNEHLDSVAFIVMDKDYDILDWNCWSNLNEWLEVYNGKEN